MPICTTCSRPVDSLFVRYGKDHVVLARCSAAATSTGTARPSVTTRQLGERQQCEQQQPSHDEKEYQERKDEDSQGCGAFADPYLEHGLAIVLLDLMLVKPRAYRHLLFNRPTLTLPTESQLLTSPQTLSAPFLHSTKHRYTTLFRRLLALLLIDAYIRWFYLCVHSDGREGEERLCAVKPAEWIWKSNQRARGSGNGNGNGKVFDSYLTVLMVTAVEMVTFHLVVGILYWTAVECERWWSRSNVARRRRPSTSPFVPQQVNNSVISAQQKEKTVDATTAEVTTDIAKSIPPLRTVLDLYTPDLAPTSMLLSQLSTLLLLGIVLLWDSEFPRPSSSFSSSSFSQTTISTLPPTAPSAFVRLDAFSYHLFQRLPTWTVDGTIRTIVGGLSAGVALGVIVPHRPIVSTAVLLVAWAVQAAAARGAVRYILNDA